FNVPTDQREKSVTSTLKLGPKSHQFSPFRIPLLCTQQTLSFIPFCIYDFEKLEKVKSQTEKESIAIVLFISKELYPLIKSESYSHSLPLTMAISIFVLFERFGSTFHLGNWKSVELFEFIQPIKVLDMGYLAINTGSYESNSLDLTEPCAHPLGKYIFGINFLQEVVFYVYAYMYAYTPRACFRHQESVSDTLELELQMVATCCVSSENFTQDLYRSSKCS
ncbi:hypothetical protein STEG23_007981, partial [Scotinomys teguina]